MWVGVRVCSCLQVRIAFNSNTGNQIRDFHCAAFKRQSISPARDFLHFSSHRKTLPLPITFNWKVMKFLFKEMIQVYEDHLTGETQDSLISVWFYAGVNSAVQAGPIQTRSVWSFHSALGWNYLAFISALPSGSYYLSNWWASPKWLHLSLRTTLSLLSKCYVC